MNVFTGVMLVFALIGFADKLLPFKWGLCESFDKGLRMMGTMVVPIAGVCTVGVKLIECNRDFIAGMSDAVPFDPTMIVGLILAPDVGGYFVSRELTSDPQMLVLNGVVLGTLLGQAVCFQMPVFMAALDRRFYPEMLKGFLVGITVVPAGMLLAEVMLRMEPVLFLKQFIPVTVFCALVGAGIVWIPEAMIKGVCVVGKVIQFAVNIMFFIAVLGLFIPGLGYMEEDDVGDALIIVLKAVIIISGALVMSELIMKVFRRQIQSAADRLGTNRVSVVCLFVSMATSLAVLPLFDEMDRRGRLINSAFSISGAYVLGGSMAFVSAVSSGAVVAVFIACKLLCGCLSVWMMYNLDKRGR